MVSMTALTARRSAWPSDLMWGRNRSRVPEVRLCVPEEDRYPASQPGHPDGWKACDGRTVMDVRWMSGARPVRRGAGEDPNRQDHGDGDDGPGGDREQVEERVAEDSEDQDAAAGSGDGRFEGNGVGTGGGLADHQGGDDAQRVGGGEGDRAFGDEGDCPVRLVPLRSSGVSWPAVRAG